MLALVGCEVAEVVGTDDAGALDAQPGDADMSAGDAAPPCVLMDRFGPSTADLPAADLAPGAYLELALCAEDEDWFAVAAPVGQAARVQVTADRAVRASLLDASGSVLAVAEGRAPRLEATMPLRGLRLRVSALGAATGYDLAVQARATVPECAEDAAEPEDAAGGALVDAAVLRGLCDGDFDHARVPGAPGDEVTVRLVVTAGNEVRVVWRQAEALAPIETHWGSAAVGRTWTGSRRLSAAETTLVVEGGPARYRLEAQVLPGGSDRAPRSVTGTVETPDRVPTAEGSMVASSRPAAGLPVLLVDADGLLVDAARCAEDGTLTLAPWALEGSPISAWGRFAVASLPGPVRVRVGPGDGTDAVPWQVPLVESLAGWRAEDATAPALHILTTLAGGLGRVAALPLGAGVPQGLAADAPFADSQAAEAVGAWPGVPAVAVRWSPGLRPRCGACFVPTRAPYLAISGDETDPDQWDDAVLLHELGHWVAAVLGHDDSPGGPHDGSPVAPTLAWSEGLADFFAAWVLDTPVLYDDRAAGVRVVDLRLDSRSPSQPLADLLSPLPERKVSQLLWFLSEGALAGRDLELWRPLFVALPGVALGNPANRGVAGVDLADWLAALACDGNAAAAEAAAAAVGLRFVAPLDCAGGRPEP